MDILKEMTQIKMAVGKLLSSVLFEISQDWTEMLLANCEQLKMTAADGKIYDTDCLSIKGLNVF